MPGIPTSANHRHATLTADETRVIFAEFATGVPDDLFSAQRTSRDDAFGAPMPLTALNTTATENGPSLSGDGLTLYYNQDSAGNVSIYTATRASLSDTFGAGQPLVSSNVFASQSNAAPTPDGQTLYFDANYSHLYRALASNLFASPSEITELATGGAAIGSPVPTADDLGLYFTRFGAADFDIWLATRTTPNAPYTEIAPVPELNSVKRDQPSWISPDGCRIYLFSDRDGGGYQLFFADRQ